MKRISLWLVLWLACPVAMLPVILTVRHLSRAPAAATVCPAGGCSDCQCDGECKCSPKVKPEAKDGSWSNKSFAEIREIFAEANKPKASPLKIVGPETADAGRMVRLSVEGDYPMLRWRCVPPSEDFEIVEAGKRAMFCSPVAGTWTFVLSASDGKELSDTVHTLTVSGPSPPGPGPGPGPKPPQPVTPLKTLAKGWIAKVDSKNKAAEAAALATAYEAIAAQISAGALSKPDDIIAAIATKTQATLGLFGLPAWMVVLEPLRAELNAREKAGPLDYAAILRELASALAEVKPAPVSAPQPAIQATPTAKSQAMRRAG